MSDDHREVMEGLARVHGWRRGIELGVGTGLLMARFLGLGIEMIGVDLGRRPDRRAAVERLGAGVTMLWMPTARAAEHVADGWADFAFVDASHSYGAVQDDIARWQCKVRPGGWFGGHDYHPFHAGVIRAVNEAFPAGVIVNGGYVWQRP